MRIPFFGTDPRQQRIDALAYDNADLAAKYRKALADLAETCIDLQHMRDSRDITMRQNAHLKAESNKLADELAAANARLLRFTGPRQRGEHGRFVKAGQPTPNGAGEVRA